jgi:quercetin dioxygenase-like cupin family protein
MTGGADIVVGPGEGETMTDRELRHIELLAEREDVTIMHFRYGPGETGPSVHVHREHVDAFYVLDGQLSFVLGPDAERVPASAGTFVAVPPNVAHTFANESDADARFLNLHTPDGGFAEYMRARRDGRDASFDSFDPPADGGLPAAQAIVSGPGEGERLVSGNRAVWMKGVLPQLSLGEWEIEGPFRGPHLHDHEAQVDSFYVVEGELEMTVEDSNHTAGAGALASIPRGIRHTFDHPGPGEARVLNIHAPDRGFADFLRGISD